MAVVRDILEAIHQRRGGQNSGSDLFGAIDPFAITPAETAANITPSNFSYLPGDLRRYGAKGDATTDDSVAFQAAVTVGLARIPAGFSFRIITGATKTGRVIVIGEGASSVLQCDAGLLNVTTGTDSLLDNFRAENITVPYVIARNPNNWAQALTPTQSNGPGYQPGLGDPELATWVAANPLVGTQNIGPVIHFHGAAGNITVSRIYGRFLNIAVRDAQDSIVRDCNFTAGNAFSGGILIDNATNNIQQGIGNRVNNNRVGSATYNGIHFFSNSLFTIRGNTVYTCGESGTSTGQAGGVQFTSSVGGASGGTLTLGWSNGTGTFTFSFSNGENRTFAVTAGQTVLTWSPALAAGNILVAAVWGITGFPASTRDPRCFEGLITDNYVYNQYYDGLDCDSVFGVTNDASMTRHLISNNYSYQNRGDGINTDGQFNVITGNHLELNGIFGIWGVCGLCKISNNFLIDNNQLRNPSGIAEILADGSTANNEITKNFIWGGASQNCPPISVTPGVPNYIEGNTCIGGLANSFGGVGNVGAVSESNIDSATGLSTSQNFTFVLQNNAGTLQHAIVADTFNTTLNFNCSRIRNAASGFTTTPTGTDSSTAFAAGAKISSANTNQVIFDTAAQYNLNGFLMGTVARNSSGTAVNVAVAVGSVNVNGVTLTRLVFQFANQTTDAAFALTTANIAAGKYIQVAFLGKLS